MPNHSSAVAARLRAAVRSVHFDAALAAVGLTAPAAVGPHAKGSAQTCHNVPKPATTFISQNEPTAPSSIRHPPSSPPSSLTPRQLHAARLLVDGHTTKAAAARLAVNPHTVSQWKKLPAFQAELTRLLNALAPPPPAGRASTATASTAPPSAVAWSSSSR